MNLLSNDAASGLADDETRRPIDPALAGSTRDFIGGEHRDLRARPRAFHDWLVRRRGQIGRAHV